MEYVHCKQIINDRLYDTKLANVIFQTIGRCYFVTTKGNYFSAEQNITKVRKSIPQKIKMAFHLLDYEFICYYENIRPETEETIKEMLAKYDTDKYQDMFGEVEHA